MKFKFLTLGLAAAAALTACSSEEIAEPAAKAGNEISFGVVAERAGRSAMLETSGNYSFTSFFVSGGVSSDGSSYFVNDEYLKADGVNTWKIESTTQPHAWPSYALDFYAYANGTKDMFDWNGGDPVLGYEVPEDATKQNDLLVSYAANCTKPEGDTRQKLVFKHALSQVVFKAKNTSENLKVVISGVSMVKIAPSATFKYKYAYSNLDENGKLPLNSWTNRSSDEKTYGVEFADVTLRAKNADGVQNLSDGAGAKDNVMLMIPQTLELTENLLDGFYFQINCEIFNVSEDGTENSIYKDKVLVAPATDLVWMPGVKYVYTFNFNGSAGYDPQGNPVLSNIEFTVDVENFDVEEQDVEAGTKSQTPATPAA